MIKDDKINESGILFKEAQNHYGKILHHTQDLLTI